MLGGLIVGKNNQDKAGIPILSDIPYLGKLFSTTTNTDDRSELMVFIQPSIVNNDRSLNAVQADMDTRYKVSGQSPRHSRMAPACCPPVDAITPVEDKAGERSAYKRRPRPSPSQRPPRYQMKPSIRPAFRQITGVDFRKFLNAAITRGSNPPEDRTKVRVFM